MFKVTCIVLFVVFCCLFFSNKTFNVFVSTGFVSEEELLSYLKSTYEKTVVERDSSVLTAVQECLSVVKTFFTAESQLEVRQK